MASDPLEDTQPASVPVSGSASNEALVRGTTIGRYVVQDVLGRGGMGVVYTAHDPELDRRIALKLLRARATDSTSRARIRREAQALARSNHPNVTAVYDVGDHGDGLFIAMELVEGTTLRAWQVDRPWAAVLAAYLDAARGLAAAHARGLVHRDFKPENVLVSRDDRAHVTDFGLARIDAVDDESLPPGTTSGSGRSQPHEALTFEGAIVGTLGYMSPEQCDGEPVDARSDQYAWCVAVWEALYGKRPFPGTTFEAIALAMRDKPPVIPEGTLVPKSVGLALLRGLAVDRDARWPTMDALIAACTPPPRKRKSRIIIAVLAIALAGAGVAIVLAMSRSSTVTVTGPTCVLGSTRLAGIWDPARRDALAAWFATEPRSDVTAALGLATRDLETYAATWQKQWDGACTSPDRTTDPFLFAQRTNCLERSLVDLEGITKALFAIPPKAFAIGWKGNLFAQWSTPLADCDRIDTIRTMPPAPIAANRDEVTKLVVDMHAARMIARTAINATGEIDAPVAKLDAIAVRLDQLGSASATEAAWWHAYFAHRNTVGAMTRAIEFGRKYHDDRWLAFAYAIEVQALLAKHRADEARALVPKLEEAYQRSGGRLANFDLRADLAVEEADYDAAIAAITTSRVSRDAIDHLGPDTSATDLVRMLIADGRLEEALVEARRHVAWVESVWRGDSFVVADAYELLAHVQMYMHDVPATLASLDLVLAMDARIEAEPERTYSARLLVAFAAMESGDDRRRDAMIASLRADAEDTDVVMIQLAPQWSSRALEWLVARVPPSPDADEDIANTYLQLGDYENAARIASRSSIAAPEDLESISSRLTALAVHAARTGGSIEPWLAKTAKFAAKEPAVVAIVDASILIAARDWKRARTTLEALALPRSPSDGIRFYRDAMLGRVLVELGDAKAAIPILRHAMYLAINPSYTQYSGNDVIADTGFALARALDAIGDHAGATRQAIRARTWYAPLQTAERAVLDKWLAGR